MVRQDSRGQLNLVGKGLLGGKKNEMFRRFSEVERGISQNRDFGRFSR